MTVGVGTLLGSFEILSLLGKGGMGEVYLAQDARLKRKVALKLLPAQFTTDCDRVHRFEQEAYAASALNHPNIITIHEIGQVDDTHFIATEFIEGQPLRQRMKGEPLKLTEALEVIVQVASALAAAHTANVVHRDIKPENIMVRTDGYVKVLDFGLAKLTESPSSAIDTEAPTADGVNTETGAVMGTPRYMSPEQARGQKVDLRSDIFSLGVVLHEMIAGRSPFEGATAGEIIGAILYQAPPPLTHVAPSTPAELERIVTKALEKDREERYQAVKEMLLDLKRLRRHLEFEAEQERVSGGAKRKEQGATNEPEQPSAPDLNPFVTSSLHATSTAASLVGKIKGHKLSAGLALLMLLSAVAAAVYFSRFSGGGHAIKSLAVLPLKSLDAGENYLGLGIADAVIRRISQSGGLTVRPTSAVRRYLNEEVDALTAARQLNVDAVLEGSVQRADDRLRVSINLLRVNDGRSLWAQVFDMRMADIFTIQDTTSQQVASGLRLQLDAAQQARLVKRSTSNPVAYEFYLKGLYSFDQRMPDAKPKVELTIQYSKKAIEADPNFALAHAQLAYAYAKMAVFLDPTESAWAERAKEEINRAQALDSQLAETHLARFQMLFSQYEGYPGEAAARELLSAQQLNPNIGHDELGYLYIHLGLEDLAERELKRALEIDPTSESAKRQVLNLYEQGVKYDEWFTAYQKFSLDAPLGKAWYFMGKGRLDEAQRAIEETTARTPNQINLPARRALLFALQGDFRSAEGMIPVILNKHPAKDPLYHHATYDIACVYALEGKSAEAVKWLRETAAWGFLPYPMFERDARLNRIRQAPEFIQFLTEMKTRWESYRRKFGEGKM